MDDDRRDSGIGLVGDIAWGTHISLIYASKDEFHLSASFIRAGLGLNELCIWIYSQNTTFTEIMELIRIQEPRADEYAANGQLLVLPHTQWYEGQCGEFNGTRVCDQWMALIRQARERGYAGLRAVGDTHWLPKSCSRLFSQYEVGINTLIPKMPFVVVCQYDARKMDVAEFAEIIKNHSVNIVRTASGLRVIRNTELDIKNSQLRASHENYQKLLDLLPDAVFIHDGERVLYGNDAAAALLGSGSPAELAGLPLAELIAAEAQEGYAAAASRLLAGESGSLRFETLFVTRGGEFRDMEVTAAAHPYGGFTAVLTIARDVSHRRIISDLENDIRETLEINRIKTDFFSNISHELRTPVSIILTALQMLHIQYDAVAPDSRVKYHNIIQQNCLRLLKLVNNLIDTNKLDSELFELHTQRCDIVTVVSSITSSVMDYADRKSITLTFESDAAEKQVECDPNAIERIMLNLISNALKFTPQGGHIHVRMVDLGERVALSVRDDGAGIPAEKLEVIFDRFRQAGHLHTREHEGSGIGLALVKALAERHGGVVSAQSEIGEGSTFTVELPCRAPQGAASGRMPDMSRESIAERINIEFSDIYSVSVR